MFPTAKYHAKMKEGPQRYKEYLRKEKEHQSKRRTKQMPLKKENSANKTVGRMKLSMIPLIRSLATRIPVVKLHRIEEEFYGQLVVPVTTQNNTTKDVLISLSKNGLNRSTRRRKNRFEKVCRVCNIRFESPYKYFAHVEDCVEVKSECVSQNYNCATCAEIFATNSDLIEHMSSQHRDRVVGGVEAYIQTSDTLVIYMCYICSQPCKTLAVLSRHLNCHNTAMSYLCPICNETYAEKVEYLKHLFGHRNRSFRCKICNQSFSRKHLAKNHVNKHLGIRPFACHICDKRYITKWHLNEHLGIQHAEYCLFKCESCEECFCNTQLLASHVKDEHPKITP